MTNPFFTKCLKHWPNIIKIGDNNKNVQLESSGRIFYILDFIIVFIFKFNNICLELSEGINSNKFVKIKQIKLMENQPGKKLFN